MGDALALVGARVGNTGGVIAQPGQALVRAGGALVAVEGATVSPHGPGPHAAATFLAGSGSTAVRVGGKGVLRVGDRASCGDTIQAGTGTAAWATAD